MEAAHHLQWFHSKRGVQTGLWVGCIALVLGLVTVASVAVVAAVRTSKALPVIPAEPLSADPAAATENASVVIRSAQNARDNDGEDALLIHLHSTLHPRNRMYKVSWAHADSGAGVVEGTAVSSAHKQGVLLQGVSAGVLRVHVDLVDRFTGAVLDSDEREVHHWPVDGAYTFGRGLERVPAEIYTSGSLVAVWDGKRMPGELVESEASAFQLRARFYEEGAGAHQLFFHRNKVAFWTTPDQVMWQSVTQVRPAHVPQTA